MNVVEVKNLSKSYNDKGDVVQVIKGLELSVAEYEFVSLFGPNGCGKTTLLNLIAGLSKPDDGNIVLNVDSEKDISIVFQDFKQSLLPWKNVGENISYPLRIRGDDKKSANLAVLDLIDTLNLKIDLNAKTYNLSGGQCQMVCLLRALTIKPRILLLDEPFSALDYQARTSLGKSLLDIWSRLKLTVIMISHDLDEALYLGSKTLFMSSKPSRISDVIETPFEYPRNFSLYSSKMYIEKRKQAMDLFQKIVNDEKSF